MKTLDGTNLITFEALRLNDDKLVMLFDDDEALVINSDSLAPTSSYPEEDIQVARSIDIELHERNDKPLVVTDGRFYKQH